MRFEVEKKESLQRSLGGLAPPGPLHADADASGSLRSKSRVFCRSCHQMFSGKGRKAGFKSFCSEECRAKITIGVCKPLCQPDGFVNCPVTFKDGSQHIKRVCKTCGKGSYISKDPEKKKIQREDFKKKWHERDRRNKKSRFYLSNEWKQLRYKTLLTQGAICKACKTTEGPFHGDHILPRWSHPHLQLVESNIQILCGPCNEGKGGWDTTDWR